MITANHFWQGTIVIGKPNVTEIQLELSEIYCAQTDEHTHRLKA